ncbi:MAG: DUF3788 domain-containing protein [Phycisphaerales bacterium]|nr:MAG: DUF3788 domain-containing protein [Phycisphaerales bacterium]
MAVSVFDDKGKTPTNQMLAKALGKSNRLWLEIKKHLEAEYGELTEEWKFYGQKTGWLLKTLRKKRNLFFFIPLQGAFRVSFVFGDKAVAVAEESDLPKELITTLKNARKYAEGRGLQIDVRRSADVKHIKKLVEIKINN